MQKIVVGIVIAACTVLAAAAIVVAGGLYDVAADVEHSALSYQLLETARDRSIAARAADIQVPDLANVQRIRRGAGNYDAMCVGCHLAPGVPETEISRGLYPRPPNLSTAANIDPARAFWVIKHGIKSTGMPAWGKSMEDDYVWDMVALVRELPKMAAERYRAEVSSSGGHSHGGGESGEHEHEHEHSQPDDAPVRSATLTDSEVLRAVDAFHSALSRGDATAVARLLDPEVLITEGGNVERSREEYAGHHLPADAKFMRSVKYTLQRQTGDSIGAMAWVASEATLTGESQGKPVDLVSTESLVLKRGADGWRVVHIHWSSRDRKQAA